MFTLLSTRKPQFEKRPVVVNCVKCLQTIHGGLLVILQSILQGWVIDNFFITTFVKLNNERYILCQYILSYDYNRILDLYVSYISFIICFSQFLNRWFLVISVIICLKRSNNYIKFHFQFQSTSEFEKHDNNNQLWQQNQPSFDICQSKGKKKHMTMSIKNQIQITLINYISKTTFNLSSHFHQVVTRRGGWFKKKMLSCYNLVKPNKSVHPITLQNRNCFLGVDWL